MWSNHHLSLFDLTDFTPALSPFYTQLPPLFSPSIICHCSIRQNSLLHCRYSTLSCPHYAIQASSVTVRSDKVHSIASFYTQLPPLFGPSIICHCSLILSSLLHCHHSTLSCRHCLVQASSANFTPPLLPLYSQMPQLFSRVLLPLLDLTKFTHSPPLPFYSQLSSLCVPSIICHCSIWGSSLLHCHYSTLSCHHCSVLDCSNFDPTELTHPLLPFYAQLPPLYGPILK